MSVHVTIRYTVLDNEAYGRYRQLAGPSVVAHGGTVVTKGAIAQSLEGADEMSNFVLIEFPSADDAATWYNSPDYQAAVAARKDAGEMIISVVS